MIFGAPFSSSPFSQSRALAVLPPPQAPARRPGGALEGSSNIQAPDRVALSTTRQSA